MKFDAVLTIPRLFISICPQMDWILFATLLTGSLHLPANLPLTKSNTFAIRHKKGETLLTD